MPPTRGVHMQTRVCPRSGLVVHTLSPEHVAKYSLKGFGIQILLLLWSATSSSSELCQILEPRAKLICGETLLCSDDASSEPTYIQLLRRPRGPSAAFLRQDLDSRSPRVAAPSCPWRPRHSCTSHQAGQSRSAPHRHEETWERASSAGRRVASDR